MGNAALRRENRARDFCWAAGDGDVKGVKKLVRYAATTDKEVAMRAAALAGKLEVVRFLVEQCSTDANAKDMSQTTALICAAKRGQVNVVRYLVEIHGVDVNASDAVPLTPLMWATLNDHLLVVKYLVEQCAADVNARGWGGRTALMLGASKGRLAVVKYFVEQCHVDVNTKSAKSKWTALMDAAENGEFGVARYLVEECGADVNSKTTHGRTAVRVAADRGDVGIQRLLTPFLFPDAASDIVPSCGIPSSCSIPPSEIELTLFQQSGDIGGDFLAKWLDAEVVVKLFIPSATQSRFDSEVRLWQQLRHPNVLKMYGACDVGPHVQLFVCEHASNGSLQNSYAKATMWKYLYQAALGLEYLHERGIIHAELRCSNILIGSDGMAKLSHFGLSRVRSTSSPSRTVGSVRWQAPEVMLGNPPSYESDVYSLGMCILEATTDHDPWMFHHDDMSVRECKAKWAPETGIVDTYDPECHRGDVRELVWSICRQNPRLRPSLSSVVYKLGNWAIKESSNLTQPENEPVTCLDEYGRGNMQEVWLQLEESVNTHKKAQYSQEFAELKRIHQRLQGSLHPTVFLERFCVLLRDFTQMVKMSPQQARALKLSSTRITCNSLYAFQWRIQSLMASLGETRNTPVENEDRWQQQRSEQIERFLSGVSDSILLLNDLKSAEERSAFLRTLKGEMDAPRNKYTMDQLEVMKKAYEAVASSLEGEDVAELAPAWFIPWYELVIDQWSKLGEGGFGSVHRAKWLDSDVVVKQVILAGSDKLSASDDTSSTSLSSLSASEGPSVSQLQADSVKRAKARAMFRREVDIWFGFSHPHVVRLFGACHVGRPFFVCEFAANGTLISFLRKHPDELWSKLHEAALGVQYLHARGVVHGDLKGNNIVIGSDKKAKVTDFGLSSVVSSEDKTLVSGAWNWVAPELLDTGNRPTFASDVYSFGMSIVEAMRVVEAVKACDESGSCLPWRVGDRAAVIYHATRGKLPSRPSISDDSQWELVKRMCALMPEKRLKISTVVDELAKLANVNIVSQVSGLVDNSIVMDVEWESVPEVIAAARKVLAGLGDAGDQPDAVLPLFVSLWDRLEEVHRKIDGEYSDACRAVFSSVTADADRGTNALQYRKGSLVSLAETTMRCYALDRSLTKFCEAYFVA